MEIFKLFFVSLLSTTFAQSLNIPTEDGNEPKLLEPGSDNLQDEPEILNAMSDNIEQDYENWQPESDKWQLEPENLISKPDDIQQDSAKWAPESDTWQKGLEKLNSMPGNFHQDHENLEEEVDKWQLEPENLISKSDDIQQDRVKWAPESDTWQKELENLNSMSGHFHQDHENLEEEVDKWQLEPESLISKSDDIQQDRVKWAPESDTWQKELENLNSMSGHFHQGHENLEEEVDKWQLEPESLISKSDDIQEDRVNWVPESDTWQKGPENLNSMSGNFHQGHENLEGEVDIWQQEPENLNSRQDHSQHNYGNWEPESKIWQKEIENVNPELYHWQQEPENLNSRLADFEHNYGNWDPDSDIWQKETENVKPKLNHWQQDPENFNSGLEDFQHDYGNWEPESKIWQKETENMKPDLDHWQHEPENLNSRLEDFQHNYGNWESEPDIWQKEKENVKPELDHLQQEPENLEAELDNWQEKAGNLEPMHDNWEQKVENLEQDNLDKKAVNLEPMHDNWEQKVENLEPDSLDKKAGNLEPVHDNREQEPEIIKSEPHNWQKEAKNISESDQREHEPENLEQELDDSQQEPEKSKSEVEFLQQALKNLWSMNNEFESKSAVQDETELKEKIIKKPEESKIIRVNPISIAGKKERKCVCDEPKEDGTLVPDYINFDKKRLRQRKVIYIYIFEDYDPVLYIPNESKQNRFPDLYLDNDDKLLSLDSNLNSPVDEKNPINENIDFPLLETILPEYNVDMSQITWDPRHPTIITIEPTTATEKYPPLDQLNLVTDRPKEAELELPNKEIIPDNDPKKLVNVKDKNRHIPPLNEEVYPIIPPVTIHDNPNIFFNPGTPGQYNPRYEEVNNFPNIDEDKDEKELKTPDNNKNYPVDIYTPETPSYLRTFSNRSDKIYELDYPKGTYKILPKKFYLFQVPLQRPQNVPKNIWDKLTDEEKNRFRPLGPKHILPVDIQEYLPFVDYELPPHFDQKEFDPYSDQTTHKDWYPGIKLPVKYYYPDQSNVPKTELPLPYSMYSPVWYPSLSHEGLPNKKKTELPSDNNPSEAHGSIKDSPKDLKLSKLVRDLLHGGLPVKLITEAIVGNKHTQSPEKLNTDLPHDKPSQQYPELPKNEKLPEAYTVSPYEKQPSKIYTDLPYGKPITRNSDLPEDDHLPGVYTVSPYEKQPSSIYIELPHKKPTVQNQITQYSDLPKDKELPDEYTVSPYEKQPTINTNLLYSKLEEPASDLPMDTKLPEVNTPSSDENKPYILYTERPFGQNSYWTKDIQPAESYTVSPYDKDPSKQYSTKPKHTYVIEVYTAPPNDKQKPDQNPTVYTDSPYEKPSLFSSHDQQEFGQNPDLSKDKQPRELNPYLPHMQTTWDPYHSVKLDELYPELFGKYTKQAKQKPVPQLLQPIHGPVHIPDYIWSKIMQPYPDRLKYFPESFFKDLIRPYKDRPNGFPRKIWFKMQEADGRPLPIILQVTYKYYDKPKEIPQPYWSYLVSIGPDYILEEIPEFDWSKAKGEYDLYLTSPNNIQDNSFDNWFESQAKNLPIKHADKQTPNQTSYQRVKEDVEKIFEDNDILFTDGEITDSYGHRIDPKDLIIRPILIGNSISYEALQLIAGSKLMKIPKDIPFLESLLVSLQKPKKILGIIPLGFTIPAQSKIGGCHLCNFINEKEIDRPAPTAIPSLWNDILDITKPLLAEDPPKYRIIGGNPAMRTTNLNNKGRSGHIGT